MADARKQSRHLLQLFSSEDTFGEPPQTLIRVTRSRPLSFCHAVQSIRINAAHSDTNNLHMRA
jgi:hypothetical protein